MLIIIVQILVGFLENWANVVKELEGLALNLAWMVLCLMGGHVMDEVMLHHNAGDGHLHHVF